MKRIFLTVRIIGAVMVSSFVFFAASCHGEVKPPVSTGDGTEVIPVSPDNQSETAVPETDAPETETSETDSGETACEDTDLPETESDPGETTEIKYAEPYEAHKVLYPEMIFDKTDVIQRLEKLLSEDAPPVWKGKIDRDGDGVLEDTAPPDRPEPPMTIETDESGEPVVLPATEYIQLYPEVMAYAYLDLTTGTTVSYNADEVLYSASLVKAAYIYSALMDIEAFFAQEHEYDEDGNIIFTDETKKYDLSEVWTYDESTMYKRGSGVIQDMGSGLQLTWRELFEYALVYSDNVAFDQIVKRFGYGVYYTAAWQIGIDGLSEGFMRLTANDCARVMKAIYEYFSGGSDADKFYGDVVELTKEIHAAVHSGTTEGSEETAESEETEETTVTE